MLLKIGTYNICHCADFEGWETGEALKVDVEKTARTIKNLQLDVIGLNEVYSEGEKEEYIKQTERLASLAGYDYCAFAVGEKFSWTTIGNSVLSRYPIIKLDSIVVEKPSEEERAIENASYWEDRVILVADVNVNGCVIKVIQSHFGLNLIEQKNIVRKVCEVIDESEYPVVLMGDFNVLPDNEVLSDIYSRLLSVTKETKQTVLTFSSYKPEKQIDYIFVSRSMEIKSCTVYDIVVSDHRPLTAEIVL